MAKFRLLNDFMVKCMIEMFFITSLSLSYRLSQAKFLSKTLTQAPLIYATAFFQYPENIKKPLVF